MQTRPDKPLSLRQQLDREARLEWLREELPWIVVAAAALFLGGLMVGVAT